MQIYFLPHLHPVPTVPGAGGARRGHVRGTRSCSRIQPSHVGLGVPAELRGVRRGLQGEPGRFLSSGADSCRASCGFPLRSPPGAVTPSAHMPALRVNPPRCHPPGAGGELEGSPWGSVSCWAPPHPPCTQSLPCTPPQLCTSPCTPFTPLTPPLCPSEHTAHPSHSALHLPTPPAPPVLPPVPEGSVRVGGDTEPPTMGHSQPHSSACRKEDAAPGGDGVRSPGCHMPAGRGTGAPGEQEAGRGHLPALPSPVTAAALPEEAALRCSPRAGYKYPPHFNLMLRRRELFRAGNGKRNPARVPAPEPPPPGWAEQCPGATGVYLKPRSRTPALTFCAFHRSRRMARRLNRSTVSYLNTSL